MAFTEKYVSVAGAGAHDGTSEANAWTFAEMISAAPAAGTRVNMKTGSYSEGATTLPAGTLGSPVVYRVYNSTIGDLDGQGRTATGGLDTTDFGTITLTGAFTYSNYAVVQNWNVTGALSTYMFGGSAVDIFTMINSKVLNTQSHNSAGCLQGDNDHLFVNCDFECSGALHNSVVDVDLECRFVNCRFKSTSSQECLTLAGGRLTHCVFHGNSSSDGAYFNANFATQRAPLVDHCTFYGIGRAIVFTGTHTVNKATITNSMVTDCSEFLDNTSATGIAAVEGNNRTRDVTTMRTNVEAITFGEITTDTGGAETDYVDAASGDFRLIAGSPGRNADLMGGNCGAIQNSSVSKVVGAGGGLVG